MFAENLKQSVIIQKLILILVFDTLDTLSEFIQQFLYPGAFLVQVNSYFDDLNEF